MTPQCKIANRETNALADALKDKFKVDRVTILSKIESWQLANNQSADAVPSVAEMEAFLEMQNANANFAVSSDFVAAMPKMLEEGNLAFISKDNLFVTSTGTIIDSNGRIVNLDPYSKKYEEIMTTAMLQLAPRDIKPVEKSITNWARTSNTGYEVSTAGDKRFSALVATFNKDITINGITIPKGTTIEAAYQRYIKKSSKGKAPSKDSILYREGSFTKEEQEDFSYEVGYLPLWKAWAEQHPELIQELREKAEGKTLTDKFASTRVSQARALSDILNSDSTEKKSESRKKKGAETLYEDEEIKKEREEVHAKSKSYSMNTQSMYGSSSAWHRMALLYGIIDDRLTKDDEETYLDLASGTRRELENPYHRAMVALRRNEIKLDYTGTSNKAKRHGRLQRLLYREVANADAVFAISEIVDPGESTHEAFEGAKTYENKADIQTVAGDSGIAVYHAITMDKPVHVFDEYRGGWFTWNKEEKKFVPESTPTLTKKAFAIGKEGNKVIKGGYNKTIGDDNFRAIISVFNKTFGADLSDSFYLGKWNSDIGLSEDELGEAARLVAEIAKSHETSIEDMYISADNAMSKLIQDMNPQQRIYRTEMLARMFSDTIDALFEEDRDGELDTKMIENDLVLSKAISNGNKEEIKALKKKKSALNSYYRLLHSSDELDPEVRKAVIKNYGINGVFSRMKKDLKNLLKEEEDNIKKDAIQKVIDNFDLLIQEALEKVQDLENFRVIPFKPANSDKYDGDIESSQVDKYTDEQAIFDDEEGARMTGNDGWSFKIRFVDPRLSLSQETKRALNSIQMLDDNGNKVRDDLGNVRYMNGEFAHAVLINDLSDMIDADDFCVKIGEDEDGEPIFEFPALEKAQKRYPWVKNLIRKLQNDNRLAGAFFHDFNKAFIQYIQLDEADKPMPLNAPVAQSAALDNLIRNYNEIQILSPLSIYDTNGINRDNAKILQAKLKDLRTRAVRLNNVRDKSILDEFATELTLVLRSLGFDSNSEFIRNNLSVLLDKKSGSASQFTTLASNIATILNLVVDPEGTKKRKFKSDERYDVFFRPELKSISKLIGKVTELDNIQSFKDGNNNRYSYSAPNYAINLIKKIKSDERRAKFLRDEFGYDEWFYKNGQWQNEWIKIFDSGTEESKYLLQSMELTEVISIADAKAEDGKIPYADWTPEQTYRVLLSQYFSKATQEGTQLARYHFPIFSDSPSNMFVTMKRYVAGREGTVEDQIIPLLINIVKQEMGRINRVYRRDQERKNPNRIDKRGLAKIQNYDKNGKKFNFFPELNNMKDSNGVSFIKRAQDAKNSMDLDALDKEIEIALQQIMEKLFSEFTQEVDPLSMVDQLSNWKAITKKTTKDGMTQKEADIANKNAATTALRDYFWNSVFATSQIIQLTTTDLAFYKNPVDFQKRFKEVYAAGNRLNTNTKYGRKTENTIYIADQIITSSRYTDTKKLLDTAVKARRMTEPQAKAILEKLKEINVADAQAFRNPYSFRAVLDMMGKWSNEMEESFERMLNGEWDSKDFAIVWQTLKPFMFSNVPTDNGLGGRMRVPHQNKNSEFLVLAFYDMMAAGLENSQFLKGVGKFFHNHPEIDVIQFESAVKAGGQGIIDLNYDADVIKNILDSNPNIIEAAKTNGVIYGEVTDIEVLKAGADFLLDNELISQEDYNKIFEDIEPDADTLAEYLDEVIKVDGEYDMDNGVFNNDIVHQLPYADYMIAQPTPEHLMDEEEATAGSQFRNLILANLPEDFSIELNIGGKMRRFNKKQIQDLYRGAIVNNLLDSFQDVKNNIFKDLHSIQQHLLKVIQGNPKYGSDIIEALQIIKVEDPREPGTYMEVFNLPLDLPTISNQVQELLTSVFKNHITKQTINGGNCIQVACCGLSRHLNIERNEDGTIKYAECMLPAWSKKFFAPFMKTVTKKINGRDVTYEELDIAAIEEADPDLLKMVGYRIPTENKYSMLPLKVVGFLPQQNGSSIMLPADITTLAGSDFDVDKMFLRIPAFEIGEDGIPRKVRYDIDNITDNLWRATSQGKMTKKQRDNMMIDIEFAILTSQAGSEQVFKPGNFDTVKTYARVQRIINGDIRVLKNFIREFGNIEDESEITMIMEDAGKVQEILHSEQVTLESLSNFLSKYDSGINALTPQTYNYFHTQNMTGASLVGLYANGASIHTKTQDTFLKIKKKFVFEVNGRTIQSLNNIYTTINGERVYIQDLIAEMQGASVDNAKDPVLADLYQSMFTAGTAVFMLRAGIDIEEVSHFFGLKRLANKYKISVGTLLGNYYSLITTDTDETKEFCSTEDLLQAQLMIGKYPKLFEALGKYKPKEAGINPKLEEEIKNSKISEKDLEKFIIALRRSFGVLERVESLKDKLKPANDIMKADSPNNAIALGFPGAVLQRWMVTRANRLMDMYDFPFEGEVELQTAVKDEFVSNSIVSVDDSRESMELKLMNTRLPVTQAFYSLGIELPISVMRERIIQGNPEVDSLVEDILKNAPEGLISPQEMNNFYRELMQFIMTTTSTFGENFDVDRRYYLYEFPKTFRKTINKYPELKYNLTISKLGTTRGDFRQIVYNKTGTMTPQIKASIRRDLNLLLYSKEPEVVKFAKDLFMYSFYRDGFNYGSNSFGTYFDATYWNSFPEVIRVLRTFRHDSRWESLLKNFEEQYIANHSDDIKDGKIIYTLKAEPIPVEGSNNILVRAGDVFSPFIGNYKYIRILDSGAEGSFKPYKLIEGKHTGKITGDTMLEYEPVPVFDEFKPVYNANMTAKEMQEVYFNNVKRKLAEKKLREEAEQIKNKKKSTSKKDSGSIDTSSSTDTEDSPSQESLANANSENDATKAIDEAIAGESYPDVTGIDKALEKEDELLSTDLGNIEKVIEQGLNEINTQVGDYLESLIGDSSKSEAQKLEDIQNQIEQQQVKMNRCPKK